MAQASGLFKQVAYKAETTYGTAAVGTGGQLLRRVSSDLSLTKQTYQSNEIRPDQQVSDFRHGVRSVDGTISGEFSPKTYSDFIGAALRRDFAAVTALTGLSITIAGTAPAYTLTRAAGSFLADGIKRGDVVRLSAGTFNAANANKNLLVTAVTATVLTVRVLNGTTLVAEGPIASATVSLPGKKTFAPTSGHTNKSFTLEHWFADVPTSEVFTGCQPTKVDLSLPATGLATISVGMTGKDIATATTQQMTAPTAAGTQGIFAAVNGAVLVGGVAVADITGLTLNISSDRTGDAVVGANTISTRFPGRVMVSGQFTAYFSDATYRDAFINESEVEIVFALTSDNTAASEFVTVAMPRVKLNGSSKSDGDGGIIQTVPFMALLPTTGGAGVANELSTLSIQDSAA